jgi:putative ABC transport system permease protein
MIFFNLLKESLIVALTSLAANKLRTFLSLLGITIGIYCIISVFTVIDSLKISVRTSIESLGQDVIYVQKWPWAFDMNYPWWKYVNRPIPKMAEAKAIRDAGTKVKAVSFVVGQNSNVQYQGNTFSNATIFSVEQDYEKIWVFELADGRFFSPIETATGSNRAVIGYEVAEKLYGSENPIGKTLKLKGRKLEVIGVFKKEGKSIGGDESMDTRVVIPMLFGRYVFKIDSWNSDPFIMVKAKDNVSNEELMEELRGIMRSVRKLKPIAEDNFALNRASLLLAQFNTIFGVLNLAGIIIGGFAILVGAFGIANIMFVSVKERTHIIGIQKSLGAKKSFILLQFLYESSLLSLIGGIIGLFLIYITLLIANNSLDMTFSMTSGNIITGLVISVGIGVLAGFIPARTAANLNPVEAINSNF